MERYGVLRQQTARGMTLSDLKRRIPEVAVIAKELYSLSFCNGVAACPFPANHRNGDRDPSLRHDKRKGRLFCASQNCFGEKGADAIALVQRMDSCTFSEAMERLANHYGVLPQVELPAAASRPQLHKSEASTALGAPSKRRVLAERARLKLEHAGLKPVAGYKFGTSLRKIRFEDESKTQAGKGRPEKTFRWEHLSEGVWYSGDGDLPKPLYVNRIFRDRSSIGPVLGFEGEAKADIVADLGLAAFSFKDITPEQSVMLAGCHVVLWPAKDASGEKQARAAAPFIADDFGMLIGPSSAFCFGPPS